jgi:putative transcriptional regulator
MMMHHPSDQSIFAYATGSLGRPLALVLGAHLEGCAQCRGTLAVSETLGGFFLEAQPPAELRPDAFSDLWARLEESAAKESAIRPRAEARKEDVVLPFALRHHGARRWLAPGIWIRPILKDRAAGTRAYLLGAAPGKVLPRHRHKGLEMTQVLEGEFFDGGTQYCAGDFLEAGDEVEHSLRVGADRECVCVIASEGVPSGLPGFVMRLIA